jgi:hypothetical protein
MRSSFQRFEAGLQAGAIGLGEAGDLTGRLNKTASIL